MKRPILAGLVVLGVVAGCGANPVETHVQAAVGDTVTLHEDAAVAFEATNVEVTFVQRVGDSRCPIGATCVWQGDAEVAVEIATGNETRETSLHTTLEPRSTVVGSYVLELLDVLPYPTLDPSQDDGPPRIVVHLTR